MDSGSGQTQDLIYIIMLLGPGSNLVRNSPNRTVRSGFIGSSDKVRFDFGSNGRKSAKKTVSVRERFKNCES